MADSNFKNGKCDAVEMITMHLRVHNKFAGSIDALGGVTSNNILLRTVTYPLNERNKKRLITKRDGEIFKVAAISPIGIAYIFVKD